MNYKWYRDNFYINTIISVSHIMVKYGGYTVIIELRSLIRIDLFRPPGNESRMKLFDCIALKTNFFKSSFLKDKGFLSRSDWTRDFRTRLKAITGHNGIQYKMLDQPACWILWLFARKTTLNRSPITTFISKALSRPSWKWVKEGHQGKGEDQSHSSLYIDGFRAKDLLMIAD